MWSPLSDNYNGSTDIFSLRAVYQSVLITLMGFSPHINHCFTSPPPLTAPHWPPSSPAAPISRRDHPRRVAPRGARHAALHLQRRPATSHLPETGGHAYRWPVMAAAFYGASSFVRRQHGRMVSLTHCLSWHVLREIGQVGTYVCMVISWTLEDFHTQGVADETRLGALVY